MYSPFFPMMVARHLSNMRGKITKPPEAHTRTAGCLFGEVECKYSHNVSLFDDTLPNAALVCKFNRYHWNQPAPVRFSKSRLWQIPDVNGCGIFYRQVWIWR